MFKRVLIANRGEIAIRIARAASMLGMESVSIYPPVDALSLHTRLSTQSVAIGQSVDPVRAYLDMDSVIAAAKSTDCDCVHPGYGFLSENATFAERCIEAGLTFVGPNPDALSLFGDKTQARSLARSLGIPIVPGSAQTVPNAKDAATIASKIGYPVMLKAAAGGGGRGMRVVESESEMAAAFARCQSETLAAFGDGSIFLEKLVPRPRHIEVQVLADRHGNIVHLYERDCSIQIRNQKVVEIAPAPNLDPALRQRLCDDAIKLARAGKYVNAGTVEFLVDPGRGEYYFIECNPRIQVEHTVTEEVTGIDLVEAQFRIAAGATLTELGLPDQATVPKPSGFAVQARIIARGPGTLLGYKEPAGAGIRVDSCGYLGYAPPAQFDPLFAKLIGRSNSTRSYESALDRTRAALAEFHIAGLPTNLQQLNEILSHPSVRSGDARTTFLSEKRDLDGDHGKSTSNSLALLEQQASKLVGGARLREARPTTVASLAVKDGEHALESPVTGTIVEIIAVAGAAVRAGDTLLVVSAMKMETALTASVAGIVTAIYAGAPGDNVAAGQVLATLIPDAQAAAGKAPRDYGDESWAPMLAEVKPFRASLTADLSRIRRTPAWCGSAAGAS